MNIKRRNQELDHRHMSSESLNLLIIDKINISSWNILYTEETKSIVNFLS